MAGRPYSFRRKKLGEINYISDDEYLLKVNQDYLQHDYYTDIITFDYVKGRHKRRDFCIFAAHFRQRFYPIQKLRRRIGEFWLTVFCTFADIKIKQKKKNCRCEEKKIII
jgi:hypothetical protein